MNDGGNVFTAAVWGLRKYAWIVVICVLGIGLLLPMWRTQGPDVYESRAQIGPSVELKLPNFDPLPRMGETVFNGGAVENAVRQTLGLGPEAKVVPNRVELVAAQDNIVFVVIGRGSTPEVAQQIADVASAEFVAELNNYSAAVGNFMITSAPDLPVNPVPTLRGGLITIILGVIGGLLLGAGIVLLIVIIRRPVVDAASAEQISATPVLGRVNVPRNGEKIGQVTELAHVCRAMLPHDPQVVWLAAGIPGSSRAAGQLAEGLARVWDKVEGSTGSDIRQRPDLVVLRKPAEDLLDRSRRSHTILVVPVGVRAKVLRDVSRAYFTGAPMSLVMYRYSGLWRPHARQSKPQTAPVVALAHAPRPQAQEAQSEGVLQPDADTISNGQASPGKTKKPGKVPPKRPSTGLPKRAAAGQD